MQRLKLCLGQSRSAAEGTVDIPTFLDGKEVVRCSTAVSHEFIQRCLVPHFLRCGVRPVNRWIYCLHLLPQLIHLLFASRLHGCHRFFVNLQSAKYFFHELDSRLHRFLQSRLQLWVSFCRTSRLI